METLAAAYLPDVIHLTHLLALQQPLIHGVRGAAYDLPWTRLELGGVVADGARERPLQPARQAGRMRVHGAVADEVHRDV